MNTCGFATCERDRYCKGYCQGHYQQVRKGQELRPLELRGKNPATCTFEGCDRPCKAKALCKQHHQQLSRGEPLRPLGVRQSVLGIPEGYAVCCKKTCFRVGEPQLLENFSVNKSESAGRNYSCKDCDRKKMAAYRKANPEKVKAAVGRWRENNPEKHARNQAAAGRRYRERHPEKVAARIARWRVENLDRHRVTEANRRNLLRTTGEMPKSAWKALNRIFGEKCMYPDCEATEDLQLDHIYPVSTGGPNTFANAQILCQFHNLSKGNRDCTDYRPNLLSEATCARMRAAVGL